MSPLISALSRLIGCLYFGAWSTSFYPQLLTNIRRRSVTGLAFDFFAVNVLGFTCYTASSLIFLLSPVVRDEYARRHPTAPEPTVRWNDFAFAAHALLLSSLTFSQFFIWGYKRHPGQKLSALMTAFIMGCIAVILVSVYRVDDENWEWIDVVYTLQFVKLVISLIKYTPQAWLNYKVKSTVGWSIENIFLDLTGGVLSLVQLLVDSSEWSSVIGNPVKFGLSQITILFDFIFITQHFVLYRKPQEVEVEEDEDRAIESGDLERQRLLS